jgi:hypothetical protein
MTKLVQKLRDVQEHYEAVVVEGADSHVIALMKEAALKIQILEAALQMGIQLCASGGHGDGEQCPTCHFMREAQKAVDA